MAGADGPDAPRGGGAAHGRHPRAPRLAALPARARARAKWGDGHALSQIRGPPFMGQGECRVWGGGVFVVQNTLSPPWVFILGV